MFSVVYFAAVLAFGFAMVLLSFQPYYLLFTLLGIGLIFSLIGVVFLFKRKTIPGLLIGLIGAACILLFVFAAVTHPEKIPFLN